MRGIGASEGFALGPVHQVVHTVDEPDAAPRLSDSRPADPGLSGSPSSESRLSDSEPDPGTVRELDRFRAAAAAVADSLAAAAAAAQSTARDVLEATAEMAGDPALAATANSLIRDKALTAERATWEAAGEIRTRLENVGGYLGERAADIDDIRDRIIAALRGGTLEITLPSTPSILVAASLSPADTSNLDPATVLAIVTATGGAQSHSAILARALGIPAVVGAGTEVTDVPSRTHLFVDGSTGVLNVQPTESQAAQAADWAKSRVASPAFTGRGELACGTRIPLLANVGSAAEAKAAAEAGAEGIGLLRTEFLFLDRDDEPTVDEQAQTYAEIFSHFPDRPVVIRTLDAGSDKPVPFLAGPGNEPNPALGMRGFRTHAFAPEVLERQLQAIALAARSTSAEEKVMAPMITTASEAARFAALVRDAGVDSAGVMVETPAAALCADSVLAPVNFASIGTNDLTQYTLAFDRELTEYENLQSVRQPAVLRLIDATTSGAAQASAVQTGIAQAGIDQAGIDRTSIDQTGDDQHIAARRPVGVCGEAAADPELAVVLVGLGVATLSMSAPALARVAARLSEVTLDQARQAAREALTGSLLTGEDATVPQPPGESESVTAPDTVHRIIHVTAPTGLHARPAALLARAVKALDAEVTLRRVGADATASAASVMDIMSLGIDPGHEVEVTASGPDALAAATAVEEAATGEA